ncbi:NADPH-dependent FMN reductase [Neisseriaceae bacterium TC5R-5]|nr:NADPH-dependent FMN reductase [Neisseriaceae bacterium TC5R-5]
MKILAICGSPSRHSRTTQLADYVATLLEQNHIETSKVSVYDFPPQALLYGDFSAPTVKAFLQQVQQASGIMIVTPVYKAAYAGALKVLLDLIPAGGLEGKPVLPLVSGGSLSHLLALDYALKPVLTALKASVIHQGVFAVDSQVSRVQDGPIQLEGGLRKRLHEAAADFSQQLLAGREIKRFVPPPPLPLMSDRFLSLFSVLRSK